MADNSDSVKLALLFTIEAIDRYGPVVTCSALARPHHLTQFCERPRTLATNG